jgi:hypothetical protein
VEQGRASRLHVYRRKLECSERLLVVLCWGIFLSKSGEELWGIASAETGFAQPPVFSFKRRCGPVR